MTALTVVSWNTQYRDPEQLELGAMLDAVRPDILLLQEALGQQVSEALPAEFVTRCFWQWPGWDLGVMIASRLPLESSGSIAAAGEPWDRERVCWARLSTTSGPFTAMAIHLTPPMRSRLHQRRDAQRVALGEYVAHLAAAGERFVVGGDFNTINPKLPAVVDVCEPGARKATWRHEYAKWLPPLLRLDAMFVSPQIKILDGHADSRWRASDHVPVTARLAL